MLLLAFLLAWAAQAQTVLCDRERSASLAREAQIAMRSRSYDLAAQRLEDAIDACPDNRELLLDLARAQAAGKRFDRAIQVAERYLAGDSGSTAGRLVLANTYLMAQQPQQALAEAERVLRDHPFKPPALKIKGNALYLLGKTGQAVDTFIQLLDRHPGDEDGAYMLGRIYYQDGQTDLAIGQFERALKLQPNSYKALDNLGLCYQAKGDERKAIQYFLSAIKLVEKDHPEYDWAYANLADLLFKTGDAQQAFNAAAKAADRNPMSARNFYIGAKALEQLGKAELSLNWVQRATALDPSYSDAWYLLARLYRKSGLEAKAEEARQRFLAAKAREPAQRK